MVTVTPRARFAFLAILQARQVPPRIGVRLAANADGRVEMAFGSAQPGDEIIQNEHTSLLIVERRLLIRCARWRLTTTHWTPPMQRIRVLSCSH